jgi:hypothetical protein
MENRFTLKDKKLAESIIIITKSGKTLAQSSMYPTGKPV